MYEYDNDYDREDINNITLDIYEENFVVDGVSYFIEGSLDIWWYEEIVEIDYPTMTRRTSELVIDAFDTDIEFYDVDGNVVESTEKMRIEFARIYDREGVEDILRRHI